VHARVWVREAPQVLPPKVAAAATGRVRVCVPVAQVTEQAPQAPHAPGTQSLGHECSLHLTVSARCGQTLPPNERWPERERDISPAPHVREQTDQADHADTTQSTGHGAVLHRRSSLRYGQV